MIIGSYGRGKTCGSLAGNYIVYPNGFMCIGDVGEAVVVYTGKPVRKRRSLSESYSTRILMTRSNSECVLTQNSWSLGSTGMCCEVYPREGITLLGLTKFLSILFLFPPTHPLINPFGWRDITAIASNSRYMPIGNHLQVMPIGVPGYL